MVDADIPTLEHAWQVVSTVFLTTVISIVYYIIKTAQEKQRQEQCRLTVCIIGAGPVGLTALIVAALSPKVRRAVLYEERTRAELTKRLQQIAIDQKTREFLESLGINFAGIEGQYRNGYFYTRCGVFIDYLLTRIHRIREMSKEKILDLKINSKFCRDSIYQIARDSRLLMIICDGQNGQSSRILNVGDEFKYHSCKAYGAMATFDRTSINSVSVPEIRVHNLDFDLSEYGYRTTRTEGHLEKSHCHSNFHIKIYGTARNRMISLAVIRKFGETSIVKSLKVILDQGIMRNLFRVCYNTYRPRSENEITDVMAIRCMKFNPRLFEVRLSERLESASYILEEDMFIITEGEASLWLNFRTGMDINLALRGMFSLEEFIKSAAISYSNMDIIKVLNSKLESSKLIVEDFIKNGMKEYMFS